MYVFYSRDIQNMKEKCGAYCTLHKDQWSSLSLVRATRSWAQSDKTACPRATTKAQAEILTGYGSVQFLPQNHLALLLIFGFLSSVPGDHHPHLSLPCNEHVCLNRTGHVRITKGERPCISKSSCKGDYKNKLGYAGKQNCYGKAGMGSREILGFLLWAKTGVRKPSPAHF